MLLHRGKPPLMPMWGSPLSTSEQITESPAVQDALWPMRGWRSAQTIPEALTAALCIVLTGQWVRLGVSGLNEPQGAAQGCEEARELAHCVPPAPEGGEGFSFPSPWLSVPTAMFSL
ncbi:zinc finger protein 501-like protein [Platysternon megacephalum]|uniref:Arachidonate 15-lipoxygenase B-like n=1 Tax=Platysternon megacephalum TaxID=55544 RepID=A0A4D9DPY1_9SAUR|nr:arachidonate 15-lipoxygenase B-like [Platysternon megacephalum]TFJ97527.1 zinc finger protein 501-like protein [Platysternon megacephalum]